jgi:UDPglucose 6-dehydrogenase
MDLAVVGLGKLGQPLAAVLAAAGHTVIGIDPVAVRVDEPGLDELVAGLPKGRLRPAYYVDEPVDVVFVVVPTPSLPDGRFDPAAVINALTQIDERVGEGQVVAIVSTLYPGTMATLAEQFPRLRLVYNPSFIALGSVVDNLRHPDVLLIGERRYAHSVSNELWRTWKPVLEPRRLNYPLLARLTPLEAEIAKLALNSYLSVKITFANTIANACRGVGADPLAVLDAIGADRRVGHDLLKPGGPPGGPCLPRDLVAIRAWLDSVNGDPGLFVAAQEAADAQLEYTVDALAPHDRICVLGLAYKPGSPVTDASFGVAVARALHGFTMRCHDPLARVADLPQAPTVEEAMEGATAVLIATPWPEYRDLDYDGRLVIDPWGLRP